jgi:phosphoesterase RecJ-like protein
MCGLYAVVDANFRKKCDMMVVSKIPAVYGFLPNVDSVKCVGEFDKSRVYDLVINVDVAALDRVCDGKIFFEKAVKTVNIDHHRTGAEYADINIINPDASSTSEVILDIAQALGWKIDYNAALSFYTGILTDTGSFRFNNTTSAALQHAAKLVGIGVDPADVYKKVYESDTKTIVLFQSYIVSRAKFLDNDKIAYAVVYKKDMEKFGADDEAMEGLTEKLRAVVTTQVAFVVKEMKSGQSKVSMRSKTVDVAKICEVFGGGGHKLAAGCTIKAAPDEAAARMLEEVRKYLFECAVSGER